MARVWIALEHVDFRNGPLRYAPGSRRWPMIRSESIVSDKADAKSERYIAHFGSIFGTRRGSVVAEIGNYWLGKI